MATNRLQYPGKTVSVAAGVSLTPFTPGLPDVKVNLLQGVNNPQGGGSIVAPSVDLNFQTGQYSGVAAGGPTAFLTTTRASQGYANDNAGNWSLFSNNIPRVTNLGLLVEEARTNSIRNNSMQGTVPGAPGTPPTNWSGSLISVGDTITAARVVNGVDTLRINDSSSIGGTFVLQAETNNFIAATPGQVWSGSLFFQLNSGSLVTNITAFDLALREYDSGAVFLRQTLVSLQAAGAALARFNTGQVTLGASTAFVTFGVRTILPGGAVAAFDVDIGWPQLELGASVTSPIRTTAAAVTRAADVVKLTSPPTFGAAYSLFAQGFTQVPAAAAQTQGLLLVGDGTAANRATVRISSGAGSLLDVVGSSTITNRGFGTVPPGVSGKFAGAFAANDQQLVTNGVAAPADTGATVPAAPSQVIIGSSDGTGSGQIANGFVQRVALWPSTRITNAQLQAMTL